MKREDYEKPATVEAAAALLKLIEDMVGMVEHHGIGVNPQAKGEIVGMHRILCWMLGHPDGGQLADIMQSLEGTLELSSMLAELKQAEKEGRLEETVKKFSAEGKVNVELIQVDVSETGEAKVVGGPTLGDVPPHLWEKFKA